MDDWPKHMLIETKKIDQKTCWSNPDGFFSACGEVRECHSKWRSIWVAGLTESSWQKGELIKTPPLQDQVIWERGTSPSRSREVLGRRFFKILRENHQWFWIFLQLSFRSFSETDNLPSRKSLSLKGRPGYRSISWNMLYQNKTVVDHFRSVDKHCLAKSPKCSAFKSRKKPSWQQRKRPGAVKPAVTPCFLPPGPFPLQRSSLKLFVGRHRRHSRGTPPELGETSQNNLSFRLKVASKLGTSHPTVVRLLKSIQW